MDIFFGKMTQKTCTGLLCFPIATVVSSYLLHYSNNNVTHSKGHNMRVIRILLTVAEEFTSFYFLITVFCCSVFCFCTIAAQATFDFFQPCGEAQRNHHVTHPRKSNRKASQSTNRIGTQLFVPPSLPE